jgi:serine/threonine protein kinase
MNDQVLLCRQKTTGNVFAMKVMKKSDVDTVTESQILRAIRHPFIVGLHFAFQTPERLHLVMEYVNGGELFFHVNNFGRFSEERVRFYSAEILLGVQCLHGKGIVYRYEIFLFCF